MKLSEESWAIRHGLGVFLQELACFVDRRWIRIDSCANDAFVPKGETEEVNCPLESFCDLLGVSVKKANEYLCAVKLLQLHNKHKTMGCNSKGWESLKAEYGLDIEIDAVADINFLGKRMNVMRIGCLGNNNKNTTFTAIQQATRFFKGEKPKTNEGFKIGWEPRRLRATRQSHEHLCVRGCKVLHAGSWMGALRSPLVCVVQYQRTKV
jgi:hypothetical protein